MRWIVCITLGIALAMWLPELELFHELEWMHSDAFLMVSSVVFSVLAAIVTSRGYLKSLNRLDFRV
jgi:hypothetical protein